MTLADSDTPRQLLTISAVRVGTGATATEGHKGHEDPHLHNTAHCALGMNIPGLQTSNHRLTIDRC